MAIKISVAFSPRQSLPRSLLCVCGQLNSSDWDVNVQHVNNWIVTMVVRHVFAFILPGETDDLETGKDGGVRGRSQRFLKS